MFGFQKIFRNVGDGLNNKWFENQQRLKRWLQLQLKIFQFFLVFRIRSCATIWRCYDMSDFLSFVWHRSGFSFSLYYRLMCGRIKWQPIGSLSPFGRRHEIKRYSLLLHQEYQFKLKTTIEGDIKNGIRFFVSSFYEYLFDSGSHWVFVYSSRIHGFFFTL